MDKDKNMCKKCWIVVVVLIGMMLGIVYKFMVQGSVTDSTDGRVSIELNGAERDLVLSEMRMFLSSIQTMTENVPKGNMEAIVIAARTVGRAAQQAVPATLMGKLPMEFKQLGFDTHTKFDQLALDAEQMGDKDQVLEQVGKLMQNCVACHAAYRIDLAPGTPGK
jgi:mono/diheme cytochrome c family protein